MKHPKVSGLQYVPYSGNVLAAIMFGEIDLINDVAKKV